MSESGRSYFPREGEFDFGFVVVHPSEVLKPREVSQGAHCHRSSLPSPPHHATVPKLPMASHPHAACTPAPPPGLITALSLPQHCTFIPESFYSCSQPVPPAPRGSFVCPIVLIHPHHTCLLYLPAWAAVTTPHFPRLTAPPAFRVHRDRQQAVGGILDRLSFFPSYSFRKLDAN